MRIFCRFVFTRPLIISSHEKARDNCGQQHLLECRQRVHIPTLSSTMSVSVILYISHFSQALRVRENASAQSPLHTARQTQQPQLCHCAILKIGVSRFAESNQTAFGWLKVCTQRYVRCVSSHLTAVALTAWARRWQSSRNSDSPMSSGGEMINPPPVPATFTKYGRTLT